MRVKGEKISPPEKGKRKEDQRIPGKEAI